MRASLCLIAVTSALLVGGCPSYTSIPDGTQQRIREMRDGQLLWLKQSMYAGDFWDDDRYRLLSTRPFAEISYLRTPEGDPLPPPPEDAVIPAGTRVRVEQVAFPTGDRVFRRPLYTPRYTTWVFLRVAAARGDTRLEHEKRHILLLPAFLNDQESFDAWFEASLTDVDPNPWIRSLPPEQRRGIEQKRAVVGMRYDALTAALGFPDQLSRRAVPDGDGTKTVEVAIYGAASVVLEDGVVVRISDPRRAAQPASSEPPPAAPTSLEPSSAEPASVAPTHEEPAAAEPASAQPPPPEAPETPTADEAGV